MKQLYFALFLGLALPFLGFGQTSDTRDPVLAKMYQPGGAYEKLDPNKELLNLRKESSKTFDLGNGTYRAVFTAGPCHYKENGAWKTISNDLSAVQGEYPFANLHSGTKTFYGNIASGIKIEENGESLLAAYKPISILALDNNNNIVSTVIDANPTTTPQLREKAGNELMYKGVYPNTDLAFTQLSGKVKSSYIINQNIFTGLGSNVFKIAFVEKMILPAGVKVMYGKDIEGGKFNAQDIVVYKNGKAILSYTDAWFFSQINEHKKDAQFNADVDFELAGNELTLKIIIPVAWLNNPATQYPIVIDPTTTVTPANVNWWTGCVDEDGQGNLGGGGGDEIGVGLEDGTGNDQYHGYMKFDLSGLPDCPTINYATLSLFQNGWTDGSGNNACSFDVGWLNLDPVPAALSTVFNGIQSMPERYAKWNVWGNCGGSCYDYPESPNNKWIDLSINTAALRSRITNNTYSPNYLAMGLDQLDGDFDCWNCFSDEDNWLEFDGRSSGNRPQLYIDYTALPATSTFGDNVWNVYGFIGGNIDMSGQYAGYYTESALSFNTLNRWCTDCSPSNASGWNGCAIGVDNHVVVSKRQGFPCGNYQLSMPNNDDDVRVYVNGNLVTSGGCCNTLTGVFWTGWLGAASTVEVRHLEGGGGSNHSLTFTNIASPPGNPATFGNGTWNTYGYAGGNIDLSGNYHGYYTEPLESYNSINRWGDLLSPSNASGWQGCVVPIDNHIVVSKRTNFTCGQYRLDMPNHDDNVRVYVNGAQVFEHVGCCDVHNGIWTGYLGPSSTIEVRHLEGGGGSNQSLTLVNLGGAPGNPAVYGNGTWNIYGYNAGDNLGNNGAWTNQYSGYYTDNTLNFVTTSRWGSGGTPSDANAASGAAYTGCPIGADYHSWSAKRTNIPCGVYQLQVQHDDRGQIFINGNSVYNIDACCTSNNAGTYAISPSDQIEYRVSEGAGGSDGLITFNNAITALNPGSITYAGSLTNCGPYDPPSFGNGASASGAASAAISNGTTTYQWQQNGVDIFGANSDTYNPPLLAAGVYTFIRKVTDKCGNVGYTNSYTLNIAPSLTITSTAANEVCPADNNGTISGVTISGGLSNVRYIRIQQNGTVDAFINLAEMSAFEIFTGTNVALNKTASAASVYQNNATYNAAKFVDGNTTNLYHSDATGTSQWIEIDLGAGYNLDRIKIWNRADCCWSRSANMQLVLKDASGTIINSRQIDVQQGASSQTSPEFNVLDVAWADGATTLNRTGLNAGTYTLNYSDVSGCSTAHAKVIGTTKTESTAPTSISGTSTICQTFSTSLSVVGGSLGTGAQWRWYPSASFTPLSATGTPVTLGPASSTTYYVRAEGDCNTTGAANQLITVVPTPTMNVGGAMAAICQGATSAQLGGSVGGGATGGTWSTPAGGTFTPNANDINATWTPPGAYTGTATLTLITTGMSPCTAVQNNKTIVVNPNPATFTVNQLTTTPLCFRGTSQIQVPGSVPGLNYQLRDNTTNVGPSQGGSGAALTFGSNALTATNANYNVLATNGFTCTTAVSAGNITVDAIPAGFANNTDVRTCYVNTNNYVEFRSANGIMVAINSNGQNLGNVTVTEYAGSPIDIQACNTYQPWYKTATLGRHWLITPQFQPASPVSIRTYFDNSDYTALQAMANANANPNDDIATLNSLDLTKYSNTVTPAVVNGTFADNCNNGGVGIVYTPATYGNVNGLADYGSFSGTGRYTQYLFIGFSEFWLSGTNNVSPLPIELTSFTAICDKGSVKLDWTTATEINNEMFLIERSVDMQSWEEVVTIPGAGNSNQPLSYSSIDDRPLQGLSYYRLTQKDYDGASETFEPISITCYSDGEGNSMMVYPNPATDRFNVSITVVEDVANANLSISDLNGKRIVLTYINLSKGTNAFAYDTYGIKPGTYVVHVWTDQFELKPVKLVIQ